MTHLDFQKRLSLKECLDYMKKKIKIIDIYIYMFPLLVNVVFPALISSIGWGLAPYYDKIALEYIDNNTLFVLRNIFVGLITLTIMLIFYKKIKITPNIKKSAKFVFYSTIASLLVGSYFYYYALKKNKKYSFSSINIICFTSGIYNFIIKL